MAKQAIGLGSTANDGTGDSLRVGGDKINDNFDEIYTTFGDGSTLTPFTTGTSTLTNKTINLHLILYQEHLHNSTQHYQTLILQHYQAQKHLLIKH